MPAKRPATPPEPGTGLERAVVKGMDLVRQIREAARSSSGVPSRERAMEQAHRAALAQHQARVRRHEGHLMGLRAGSIAGGVGGVVLGAGALGSLGSGAADAAVLGVLAGASALGGIRSRLRARELRAHPPVPVLPPLPPARVRPGARGGEQVDRVANALMHLYDLLPNVARIYPAAGAELWRAVSEVEPLLRGQAERLAALDRIQGELPGSRASVAAGEAAGEIAARLRQGADALEDLIAASVGLLAAPDLGDPVDEALSPAILSLQAFAHGLNAADVARRGGSDTSTTGAP